MWTAVLYDTNNDGYISDQEMINATNDWQAGKISDSQLQEVSNAWLNNVNLKEWAKQNIDRSFVSRYDTDSNGYISYQEFSAATSQYQTGAINYVQYAMVAAAYKYGINVGASVPAQPSLTCTGVSFIDSLSRGTVSKAYPDSLIEVWYRFTATASKGATVSFTEYAKSLSRGTEKLINSGSYTFTRDYISESWSPPAGVYKISQLMADLGITSNDTIQFRLEVYYNKAKIAECIGNLAVETKPYVTPDLIVSSVAVVDASTHIETTTIEKTKNYYFTAVVKAKGNPGDKFILEWRAYDETKTKSFLLFETEFVMPDYAPDYKTYNVTSIYAVEGGWIISMMNANGFKFPNLIVCCIRR